jgi:gamma-glutamyltranspeptidase/glutathione hydrolase
MIRLLLAACLSLSPVVAGAADTNPAARAFYQYDQIHQPVLSKTGMVSAQDGIAAKVGADILKRGGNAVDAAVAVGFALAVTHPQAGNIGGGGFMMLAQPDGALTAIDFREQAPAMANRDMYLGPDGNVDTTKAQYSRASAGVPGSVAGLLHALDTYGTMTRRQVMGPAIRLADQGFIVSPALSQSINTADNLRLDESSLDYFGGLKAGDRLRQTDLAESLRRIMKEGRDGFYKGRTADLIVAEMQAGNGIMTHDDLAAYEVVERIPVTGSYGDYTIAAMPPPSSGGVHMVQMLNILSGYDLKVDGHNSAAYLHKLIEVMRRAYADRSVYLGDPDFFDVPVDDLTDPLYADRIRAGIDLTASSRSEDIRPGAELPYESLNTTHYSVIDEDGRAVSVTYTLNFSFGSGYSVDGAGFLLNNEMDDFSSKPGAPNGYGLVGGEANKIEPRKRPLSSMTPTIVLKDGKPVLATGSPGGSTIITSVLQTVLNVVEWDMNTAQSLHSPRIHHQWLPDLIIVEPGISPDTVNILEDMGHLFPRTPEGEVARSTLGLVNSVGWNGEWYTGAADPRAPDSLAVGP